MNIKKILSLGLISVLAVGLLAGCSSKKEEGADSPKSESKKIVIGATAVPHAAFLKEFAEPKLKEKGIELEVKEFTDYNIPNKAVADKQLDANYFQHVQYLEDFNQKNNGSLVVIGKIHAEPLAAYSKKIKSVSELKDGATIAIPSDNSNAARALKLLQKQGLIELKDKNAANQTERDIVKNPKNLKIKAVAAEQLPRLLDEVEVSIINGNYALEAKLGSDKIVFAEEVADIEKYVNVVVSREDNKDNASLKELVNILKSEDAKKYLKEKYDTAVIPAE